MLPTFFIPHGGGPCFFMDWNPPHEWNRMRNFLKNFISNLEKKPEKIVIISAHWEEEKIKVTSNQRPQLIYDYFNFPKHTYELTWKAKGCPTLALRIKGLLEKSKIECVYDHERGFDHGVFIPLKLALPDADLPTVALSLNQNLDPYHHLMIGSALKFLRNEGVLIIGSGMSFHNLDTMLSGVESVESRIFDDWLTKSIEEDPIKRQQFLKNWKLAPHALMAHPREEHLTPLFIASGAAENEKGKKIFGDKVLGAYVSAYQFG